MGLGALLVGWRCHRNNAVQAGIQCWRDAADGAALAGGIHAFISGNHRMLAELWMARQQREVTLVFAQLRLVAFLCQCMA